MESQNHVHVNDVFNLHHEVVVKRHLERMTLPEGDYADFGEKPDHDTYHMLWYEYPYLPHRFAEWWMTD